MKISVDAGGYCTNVNRKYGNYTFTDNIIKALYKYDKKNSYYLYSFCPAPQNLVIHNSWKYLFLKPRKLWMKFRVSLEEFIHKKDIFLGFNQAVPSYSGARIISFSHGLSYYFFPQYYRESFIRLSLQLAPMIKKSKYIIVSSIKVMNEMKIVYPNYKNVIVMPYGIPFDMLENGQIIKSKKPFFLYVGMNHPIKNIKFIIKAFKKFRKIKNFSKYELFLIGSQGMYSQKKENIKVIPSINREELRNLYSQAMGYLTASLYESFNFPVLEALSQSCSVIGLDSAIIPEFIPYVESVSSLDSFVEKMVLATEGKQKKYNRGELFSTFSWKKYIENLLKLYTA